MCSIQFYKKIKEISSFIYSKLALMERYVLYFTWKITYQVIKKTQISYSHTHFLEIKNIYS